MTAATDHDMRTTGEPPNEEERLLKQQAIETQIGLEADLEKRHARMSNGWGERLTPGSTSEQLTLSLARTLVEAGFEIHDCAANARTGGVCLTPTSQRSGVIVTWTTHDTLRRDPRRHEDDHDVHQVMNYALFDALWALGWDVREYGKADANLVVGRRARDTDPHQESR